MSDQEQSGGSLYFPFMAGFYAKFSDFGYPIIRFFTGLMMMPHGAQKLFGMFGGGGLDGTAGFFSKVGLEPAYPLAILVGCAEFFGGALRQLADASQMAAIDESSMALKSSPLCCACRPSDKAREKLATMPLFRDSRELASSRE